MGAAKIELAQVQELVAQFGMNSYPFYSWEAIPESHRNTYSFGARYVMVEGYEETTYQKWFGPAGLELYRKHVREDVLENSNFDEIDISITRITEAQLSVLGSNDLLDFYDLADRLLEGLWREALSGIHVLKEDRTILEYNRSDFRNEMLRRMRGK